MTSDQEKVMDVVFLIDATGSMSSAIKAAHDKAAEMAINLRVKTPNVNFMFGSVCYRDPVDSPSDTHDVHQLNPDIDTLVSFFSTIRPTSGGDGPEDWVGAYRLLLKPTGGMVRKRLFTLRMLQRTVKSTTVHKTAKKNLPNLNH
jgi:hypothetical protein